MARRKSKQLQIAALAYLGVGLAVAFRDRAHDQSVGIVQPIYLYGLNVIAWPVKLSPWSTLLPGGA